MSHSQSSTLSRASRRDGLPTPVSCHRPYCGDAPGPEECRRLWEAYEMPDHIREHSLCVATIADTLAELAQERGIRVCREEITAAGMLHDIAKAYTIRHGGNHAQLGGAWAIAITGNRHIAQGVVHHIYWPGPLDPITHFLPLAVIYSDKRVMHDRIVTIEERFEDLLTRYGSTEYIRARIQEANRQALAIERSFCDLLEVDLHAYSFDRRRLVR